VPTGSRNRLINLFTGRQRNRNRFSVLVALPLLLGGKGKCVSGLECLGARGWQKVSLDNIRMQNIFENARRQQGKHSRNIADILLGTMNLFLAFYDGCSPRNFSILTENNGRRRINLSGLEGISVCSVK